MMRATTVLLEVVPADGTAAWADPAAGVGYRSFQSTLPSVFGTWQPAPMPITIRHGGPVVGHIHYLEHDLGHGDGQLFAVGVVEGVPADEIDGVLMASAEIKADALARTVNTTDWSGTSWRRSTALVGDMHATTAELHGVALVDQTASLTSTRCRAWDGDYLDPVGRARWTSGRVPAILHRAAAVAGTELRHRRAEQLRVHRPEVDQRSGLGVEVVHHGGGYIVGVR